MTRGLLFLLCLLIEIAVAGILGWLFARRHDAARADMILRCCTAAMIGTGVTQPAFWLWSERIEDFAEPWLVGAAVAQILAILLEMLVYAAALRGRWWQSLAISSTANLTSLATGLLLAPLLPQSH